MHKRAAMVTVEEAAGKRRKRNSEII